MLCMLRVTEYCRLRRHGKRGLKPGAVLRHTRAEHCHTDDMWYVVCKVARNSLAQKPSNRNWCIIHICITPALQSSGLHSLYEVVACFTLHSCAFQTK